jgi:hypothetical protein
LLALKNIGPATRRDLELLGISTIAQLARREPDALYAALERKTGQRQDPCVWDHLCRCNPPGANRRGSPMVALHTRAQAPAGAGQLSALPEEAFPLNSAAQPNFQKVV